MIKVDRSSVDKAIEEINLFPAVKNVIAEYKAEALKLEDKENQLNQKHTELQEKLTANLVDRDHTEDLGQQVYLTRQAKEITEEAGILSSMLENLAEQKTELKCKYVPLINEAKSKANTGQINANEIVNIGRYEMLKAIADLANEMQRQYREVAPDVLEVFSDPAVKERFSERVLSFSKDVYKPAYAEQFKTVISRYDVFNATNGSIPSNIKRPKENVQ